MEECHKWITYANECIPVSGQSITAYLKSYLALEFLTYLEKNEGNCCIKFSFPLLCKPLLDRIKDIFTKSPSTMKSPIIQGLLYVEYFLRDKRLNNFCVHAKNPSSELKISQNYKLHPLSKESFGYACQSFPISQVARCFVK